MKKIFLITICSLLIAACNKANITEPIGEDKNFDFISGVDISSYPEISKVNPTFYDLEGNPKDFLLILKENGVNTIRLRLWVNPSNEHSSFEEVKKFSDELKNYGFRIWLNLHYSDTWADPGHQTTPKQWQGISFNDLKDSVYNYTKKIVSEIKPDYIQIGNEINSGFLHPYGEITSNPHQFLQLVERGITAVRENSKKTIIILHYAGIAGSDWFFNLVKDLDYDVIALSYYPLWHGKSLDSLKNQMEYLSSTFKKKILIAETAYPFTLRWNDWTHNIVGLEEQLILPEFPATPEGQQKFVKRIKTITKEIKNSLGFCYWGAELIAWKGPYATDGSPWENQALFDFNNKALPALSEFK
jgi:arabinogalactan endo-1,4-beta-galactosidase